jgi:hypothetical protein
VQARSKRKVLDKAVGGLGSWRQLGNASAIAAVAVKLLWVSEGKRPVGRSTPKPEGGGS